MDINTRLMEIADLDRICQLEERSFSMPWTRKDFEEMIARGDSAYFVICDGDTVIGTAGYTFNGFEGYINNVVIDEEYRNLGLGKVLMQALLDYGKRNGINEYTLEVRVGNVSANRLYESLGFVSEGIRRNFYERPTEDAYVMWLR
jgi:[ribosomal protein S18]-alanine N-acetyltransferase